MFEESLISTGKALKAWEKLVCKVKGIKINDLKKKKKKVRYDNIYNIFKM